MDNTLLRIESKARDTVKLIALLRHNGVDVAQVEEAIKQVKTQKVGPFFIKKNCVHQIQLKLGIWEGHKGPVHKSGKY